MNDEGTLVELTELEEGVDVEVKKAGGKDGQGELPRSFVETYSAMANTDGVVVYLGVEQQGDRFFASGVSDVARVKKAWSRLRRSWPTRSSRWKRRTAGWKGLPPTSMRRGPI